jgi:hypothetical protein
MFGIFLSRVYSKPWEGWGEAPTTSLQDLKDSMTRVEATTARIRAAVEASTAEARQTNAAEAAYRRMRDLVANVVLKIKTLIGADDVLKTLVKRKIISVGQSRVVGLGSIFAILTALDLGEDGDPVLQTARTLIADLQRKWGTNIGRELEHLKTQLNGAKYFSSYTGTKAQFDKDLVDLDKADVHLDDELANKLWDITVFLHVGGNG